MNEPRAAHRNRAEESAVVSLVVGGKESRRIAWEKHCKTELGVKDPKWFPCAANSFLLGGTPEKLFNALPRQPAELESLWVVDEIVFREMESSSPPPRPLGASSFAAALHEILAKLASGGKREALERMLVMQVSADGWYAEELAELNAALFSESPSLLVENFEVVRPYRGRIEFSTTDVDAGSDAIRARYRAYCKANKLDARRCEEAADFLLQ